MYTVTRIRRIKYCIKRAGEISRHVSNQQELLITSPTQNHRNVFEINFYRNVNVTLICILFAYKYIYNLLAV